MPTAEDERHLGTDALDREHRLRRGDAIKTQIQNYRGRKPALEHLQCFIQSARSESSVTVMLEQLSQRGKKRGIVVHDQNATRFLGSLLEHLEKASQCNRLRK